MVNWKYASLFLAGVFGGGGVSHAVLAARNLSITPLGFTFSPAINWIFAAVSLAAMVILLRYALK